MNRNPRWGIHALGAVLAIALGSTSAMAIPVTGDGVVHPTLDIVTVQHRRGIPAPDPSLALVPALGFFGLSMWHGRSRAPRRQTRHIQPLYPLSYTPV